MGDTLLACLIVVIVVGLMAGFYYDLSCLLDEVGASGDAPSEVEEPSVLVASLTAAGADNPRPYDWQADVA